MDGLCDYVLRGDYLVLMRVVALCIVGAFPKRFKYFKPT